MKGNKSCSSAISYLFKSLDYFSITFEFRVDKKTRYGSITGGLLYLIYIFFAAAFIMKSFFDYISFTEIKISYLDKSMETTPPLNYKNMNFSYAIQITFENDTSLRNTNYSDLFLAHHNIVFDDKKNNEKNKIKSLPRQCTNDDFYNQSNDFPIFNRKKIRNFDCFDIPENFTLQGIYTDDNMTYAEILLYINPKFLRYQNDSFYDYKNLEKIFNNDLFKFTLYYIDTYNDVSDKNKPVFYKLDSTYMYLDFDNYRRNNIYFQQFLFSEDRNLIYKDYARSSYMKLFSLQEIDLKIQNRLTSSIEQRAYLSKFVIRPINNQKIIRVSYIKIPEFLASLSGLLVNTLIILRIFMFSFNKLEAKQKIINKIMKYKDLIKSNNQKTLNYLSNKFVDDNYRIRRLSSFSKKKINSQRGTSEFENPDNKFENESVVFTNTPIKYDFQVINDNDSSHKTIEIKNSDNAFNTLDSLDSLNQNLNPKTNELIGFKKQSSQALTPFEANNNKVNDSAKTKKSSKHSVYNINKNPYAINAFNIICKIFCCRICNKKRKIFKIAEKRFNHNIDLVTYMKKMNELEIIKFLLLDKHSLELVNFLSKPCISMSSKGIDDPEYKLFFEATDNGNSLNYRNIDKIKKSYDEILTKEDKTNLDKRVLKLFDFQIEEIIE